MNDETREIDEQQAAADWEAALAEQADSDTGAGEQPGPRPAREVPDGDVKRAGLEGLTDDARAVDDENVNLDVILDIPVTLAMEIGRTRMSIRNLLQLNQGSVVELDRLAGEPLDVLVNGTLIAHGEVVVVNERFGIRLTDVISPSERVKKLR
ncbi:MAG: flagellar motor switch protein FliN [Ectothiorhodospiraceae bacterium]|nr:flagellar motor switch protein FliN [Ectothiorhodospiraceae bacterium]